LYLLLEFDIFRKMMAGNSIMMLFSRKITFLNILLVGLSPLFADQPDAPRERSGENDIVKISPIGIEAVLLEGGSFEMGDKFNIGDGDEKPVHKVTLSDFYISVTEVTIQQYKMFCRKTGRKMPMQGSDSKNDYPVAFVTWFDAMDFCKWVEGSLPTEAQWEYAATLGGMSVKYPTGNDLNHSMANYSGTGKKDRWKRISPVAKFPPNIFGIYDLAGNVYEWCFDYYKSGYYSLPAYRDPRGPATSMFRVLRGGSWYHDKDELRSSDRFRYMPVARVSFVGFRVVWDPKTVNTDRTRSD
jgi:formylglycine-generating enzyme required for sulfatase activity